MSAAAASLTQAGTAATHAASSVFGFLSAFVVLLVLAGALFLFARYVGRGPFAALLLSFYGAYALYATFPFMTYVPSAPALTAVTAHLALYVALVAAFYLILRRMVVSDFLSIGLVGFVLLSFLGAAFLIAIGYQIFAVTQVYGFTPALDALFAPKAYFFWWFAAPAIGLFFLAR
jgi:hypothetical protein